MGNAPSGGRRGRGELSQLPLWGPEGRRSRFTPGLPWPGWCVLFFSLLPAELVGGTWREVEIGRETSSSLTCPQPSQRAEAECREDTRRSRNCFGQAAPRRQLPARVQMAGRREGSTFRQRTSPPAEVLGRLRGPGAGGSRCLQVTSSSLLPASRPEPLGVLFWKYFQAL